MWLLKQKKEASIVLESSAINMMIDDRENFTFNPIKVCNHFSLIDSQITFDRESLKNREVELGTVKAQSIQLVSIILL